ncbi:hypothetical protein E2562_022743 [Oryza meyeriana var. granulata]|uniref:Uncharacterized protein n=1 Tax=Oryza meyeriana var. granulata TaxID=110450 RepID=A0A6G1FAX2_9ORYZ|nr:hypothetical protein E2562_022743 [Oryza meyeriana var. granulata]
MSGRRQESSRDERERWEGGRRRWGDDDCQAGSTEGKQASALLSGETDRWAREGLRWQAQAHVK